MNAIGSAVQSRSRALVLARVGALGAAAFVLMYLETHLPGFPAFLQYDTGDLPALIGGFAMGPVTGMAVVVIRSILFFLSGKDEAGWIGTLASLVASLSYVGTATLVYWQRRTFSGAVLGLLAGILALVVTMGLANYYLFIPLYLGQLEANVLLGLVRTTALFNLVKGILTGLLVLIVYKRVRSLLR